MELKEQVSESIEQTLSETWSERESQNVPDTDDVALKNGAVKVDAAFLYADLAGSSTLAKTCPWETTAKIIRAYLVGSVRIIRGNGGYIRSFDGDRVMGVFMGKSKRTSAVKSAREIDYMVTNILNPKVKRFSSIKENSIRIQHCVGVDSGTARAVRGGIRNNNDLIWIGRPPSIAAKLSDIRNYPFEVYITDYVYKWMADEAKNDNGTNNWECVTREVGDEKMTLYKNKIPYWG